MSRYLLNSFGLLLDETKMLAISLAEFTPKKKSTSLICFFKGSKYLWERQPVTIIFVFLLISLIWHISRINSMLSCLACLIKPQVLMIKLSALYISFIHIKPKDLRVDIMYSESTTFLLHPRVRIVNVGLLYFSFFLILIFFIL